MSDEKIRSHAREYTAGWNSGDPSRVASHYAGNGQIVINRGEPCRGRSEIEAMAAGFFAAVPDLTLTCDAMRIAGDHAVFWWTFTGHDAGTGNPLSVEGWEEWDFDADGMIAASRGWFDADGYARQIAGS